MIGFGGCVYGLWIVFIHSLTMYCAIERGSAQQADTHHLSCSFQMHLVEYVHGQKAYHHGRCC